MNKEVYIGVDIGSATVKVVGINIDGEIEGNSVYLRHDTYKTQIEAVKNAFRLYLDSVKGSRVAGIGITGSGRELNKKIIGADLTRTEIFAHSVGVNYLLKKGEILKNRYGKTEAINRVGSIIEIGGQDSKVIIFGMDGLPSYFNMNTICSAGTGEFLKQIADEAGITLESFGKRALEARNSTTIDSTCTVFSRRDFRHLTQKGVALSERLAGICDAMVSNYIHNVVKDMELPGPVLFQGGVAFNEGVRKAFEKKLNTDIIIPPHNDIIGALGMASIVMDEKLSKGEATTYFKDDFYTREYDSQIRFCHGCQNACELSQPIERNGETFEILDTLGGRCEGSFVEKNVKDYPQAINNIQVPVIREGEKNSSVEAGLSLSNLAERKRSAEGVYFAGIDGGSRGTKYSLIKAKKDGDIEIVSVGSVDTSGDAIKAIMHALIEIEKHLPTNKRLGGIATTGSAGEMARDIVTNKTKDTADVKVTEIIAHATWARHMVPDVKVIMDIGGNDAKIILLNDHGIEFAMNDKCAAGAGAFIEAIAKRFEVPLQDFGKIALTSKSPARISGRCAVFGESDMIHKSRSGFPTNDLFMGLAYSICRTYLSDIGKGKAISVPIVAQGGTFLNTAIQKAFKETLKVSEKELIIAKDKRLVLGAGALGAALLSKEAYEQGLDSSFKGFDHILSSYYDTKSLTCSHTDCDRSCKGVITLLENDAPISGYKSINCDFGLFDGLIEDMSTKGYIEEMIARGLA